MNDSTTLTPGQTSVLKAFHEFGPMHDVALAVYAHHIVDDGQSSSGLRTRRSELVSKGLLTVSGEKLMPSGRKANVHTLSTKGKKKAKALFATTGATP